MVMESPFDYPSQSAIYLPEDLPDPREERFAESAGEEILKILEKTRGRALILFTSHRNMEEVYGRIAGRIPFRTLKQGDHPRSVLLRMFSEDVHSVLFATGSFWQGVDVQGESLSCVIVDKLPFASPSDPLVGARIDWIEKNGGNPFLDYQVPSAVLMLKQGFGRLIRN
jgi:ATP-dependent DNA helicase DinG